MVSIKPLRGRRREWIGMDNGAKSKIGTATTLARGRVIDHQTRNAKVAYPNRGFFTLR
jgi:hypothetical protein